MGSLADHVLAEAILIPPAHHYKEGKGPYKEVRKVVPEKQFIS